MCFGPERAGTEGMRSLSWDSAMTLSLQPVRQGGETGLEGVDFVFGGEAACEEVLRGVDVESVLHTPEELRRQGLAGPWDGSGFDEGEGEGGSGGVVVHVVEDHGP